MENLGVSRSSYQPLVIGRNRGSDKTMLRHMIGQQFYNVLLVSLNQERSAVPGFINGHPGQRMGATIRRIGLINPIVQKPPEVSSRPSF